MAMGFQGGKGRKAPMSEINVTPLVDVMLVLLIIFMVTAPLLVTGVPVDLPKGKATQLKKDDKPVQIAIDKTGQIFIGDRQIAENELETQLKALRAARSDDVRLYLRADASLPYATVMRVMGAANAANFRKIALINREDTGSKSRGARRP